MYRTNTWLDRATVFIWRGRTDSGRKIKRRWIIITKAILSREKTKREQNYWQLDHFILHFFPHSICHFILIAELLSLLCLLWKERRSIFHSIGVTNRQSQLMNTHGFDFFSPFAASPITNYSMLYINISEENECILHIQLTSFPSAVRLVLFRFFEAIVSQFGV